MAQVNLMTQAQYAKHRGCSRVAVHNAVKENRISLIDGKIDANVADIQRAANTRARAPSSPPAAAAPSGRPGGGSKPSSSAADPGDPGQVDVIDTPEDYWVSRGRREAAEAELAELKLAEQRGNLIQVKAVEVVLSNALAGMREHLLQVSSRLAPLLANESDNFKVQTLLDTEINQALQQLAGVTLPGASSPAVAA
jgi:hypothetical protein